MRNKGECGQAAMRGGHVPGSCYSEEDLRAFHLGSLAPDKVDAVAEHLETCPTCETVIERLERAPGPVLEALRKAIATTAKVQKDEAPSRSGTLTPEGIAEEPWPELPDYTISAVLGWGGMGVVYRALQVRLNRPVALKQLSCRSRMEAARARAEAELLARLQHSNIVQIHEVVEDGQRVYLALELLEGGPLSARVAGKPQTPREAAALVETLARALHYAHERGIIHRDIKPGNVLLTNGNSGQAARGRPSLAGCTPKITDFGIAKLLSDEDGQTRDGDLIGTPSYMAPEQATARAGAVGPATDVYSLGVLLYELLTGRVPLQGTTSLETLLLVRNEEPVSPRRLQPRIPRSLETICLKCLQKEPGKRYQSAALLAEDLRRFLAHEPILARPAPPWERLAKWARRHPGVAALTVAVLLVATLGFALVSWQWQRAEDKAEAEAAARLDAQEKERQEKEARRQAERLMARTSLNEAAQLCERGQVARGLLWTARALELADNCGDTDVACVARCNLSAWHGCFSPLRARFFHAGWAWAVAFSPDGKTALTGGTDGVANLWDTASGQRRGQPLSHPAPVWTVAFSPDGKTVLTGCGDEEHHKPGEARLWDAASGRLLESWQYPRDVSVVAFSPDGRSSLVAAENQATLRTGYPGRPVRLPLRHPPPKRLTERVQPRLTGAFSPDSKRVVTAGEDGSVRLWDAGTAESHGQPMQVGEPVIAVAISPDGRTLLTGGFHGNVSFWDMASGRRLHSFQHGNRVRAVAFSPDGRLAATGTGNDSRDPKAPTPRVPEGEVRLWNTATGRPVGPPLPHPDTVWCLGFTPGGRMLVTGARDAKIRVFLVASGEQLGELQKLDGTVANLAISPDGALVLAASAGGGGAAHARLWQLPAEGRLPRWLLQEEHVLVLCFSPDGRRLLSGGDDKLVHFWDVATGRPTAQPLPHDMPVTKILPGPGGRLLVAIGEGPMNKGEKSVLVGSASLWDLETRRVRGAARNVDRFFSAALDPQGHTLLLGDEKGKLHLWEMATGKPLTAPLGHAGPVFSLGVNPDGRTFLMTSGSQVLLCDLQTRRILRQWPTTAEWPGLYFYPGGKEALLLENGFARVLDVEGQRWKGPPLFHPQGGMVNVAFAPDGRTLLIRNADYTARLWDVATGKIIGPMLGAAGAIHPAFSPDGRHMAVGRRDGIIALGQPPRPLQGDPERLRLWVEILTGMELDREETIRPLSADELQERRGRLEALGGPPLLP
jgi:WD40 repeat protein/tRNA A-37 threonylcarbamoyl transferase component Bud32